MSSVSQYHDQIEMARARLVDHGIPFEKGLSDEEVDAVEKRFGFVFPTDLRQWLQIVLPVGHRFPNWRGEDAPLLERLTWPIEGICFDIRNNVFWWPEWGLRPSSNDEAVAIAMEQLSRVPMLVPIYGGAYLPCEPNEIRNPVFSVHQADVIHCASDLGTYLLFLLRDTEDFDETQYPVFNRQYKWIRFWSALTEFNWKL